MSESKALEREQLKYVEPESDKSESEHESDAMRLHFRERVKERQQKLQQESESKTLSESESRTRSESESKQVPKTEDSLTDKARHLSAEDMKTILLKRDSPLLRSRYAEAKRKKDQLSGDESRDSRESSHDIRSDKTEDKNVSSVQRSRSGLTGSRPLSTGDGDLYRKYLQKDQTTEHKPVIKTLSSDQDNKKSLRPVSEYVSDRNVTEEAVSSGFRVFNAPVKSSIESQNNEKVSNISKQESQKVPKKSQGNERLKQCDKTETVPGSAKLVSNKSSSQELTDNSRSSGKMSEADKRRRNLSSNYLQAIGGSIDKDDNQEAKNLSTLGVSYSKSSSTPKSEPVIEKSVPSSKQGITKAELLKSKDSVSKTDPLPAKRGFVSSRQVTKVTEDAHLPGSQTSSRKSSLESTGSDKGTEYLQRIARTQTAKGYRTSQNLEEMDDFKGFKLFDVKKQEKDKSSSVETSKDPTRNTQSASVSRSGVRRVESAKVTTTGQHDKEAKTESPSVVRRAGSARGRPTQEQGQSSPSELVQPGQRSVRADFLENTDLRNLDSVASSLPAGMCIYSNI